MAVGGNNLLKDYGNRIAWFEDEEEEVEAGNGGGGGGAEEPMISL